MNLQGLIRFLLPREDHFYDYLEQQADTAHLGALALVRFKEPDVTPESVRSAVQEHEHAGDKVVHAMEEALAMTFVTPIDREDLQRLSAQLDDVLDLANGAARACVLYGVERPTEAMVKLTDYLQQCTGLLKEAMPKLRRHQYAELMEVSRTMRQIEKDADVVFREAISRLFHDAGVDARRMLREKEVLEDLENAVDHCEHVAETLANLAVKHG